MWDFFYSRRKMLDFGLAHVFWEQYTHNPKNTFPIKWKFQRREVVQNLSAQLINSLQYIYFFSGKTILKKTLKWRACKHFFSSTELFFQKCFVRRNHLCFLRSLSPILNFGFRLRAKWTHISVFFHFEIISCTDD